MYERSFEMIVQKLGYMQFLFSEILSNENGKEKRRFNILKTICNSSKHCM